MSDIEGKVTRVGATKRGQRRSFKPEEDDIIAAESSERVQTCFVSSVSLSLIPCVTR
jgi:hypothetical protein